MFGALADAGVNIEMISTSEVRITCTIAEDQLEAAVRALHAAFELARPDPSTRTGDRRRPRPGDRLRFLAPAGALRADRRLDERRRPRLAGRRHARGLPRRRRRADRRAAGARAGPGPRRPAPACSCSLGFRPAWLAPGHAWRLAATCQRWRWPTRPRTSPACRDRTIRLKWPNDLVSDGRMSPGRASADRRPGWRRLDPQARRRPGRDRTAWAPTTRGSSSGSGSTPTGPRPTSRPTSRRR